MKTRYWLRGGVVGLLLFCLGFLITLIIGGPVCFYTGLCTSGAFDPVHADQALPLSGLGKFVTIMGTLFFNKIGFLAFVLGGAFFSHFYGKVKLHGRHQ